MNAHGMFCLRVMRFEPRTRGQLHHAVANIRAQNGCGKATAATVEQPDDIAIGNATTGGIFGVDTHGFAAPDLCGAAESAIVELAVQPLMRLVADEMQRIKGRIFRCRSAGIPLRMAAAIIITETFYRLGEDFDFSGWRLQREGGRIVPEGPCRPSIIRL